MIISWNRTNLLQYPVVFRGANYNPEYYKVLEGAFDVLDKFLNGQDYVAGRNLTIADLALAATVSTSEVYTYIMRKREHYLEI